MTLRYNLTGADRKRLVTAISEITGAAIPGRPASPTRWTTSPSTAMASPHASGRSEEIKNSSKRWTARALNRRAEGREVTVEPPPLPRRAVHLHASQLCSLEAALQNQGYGGEGQPDPQSPLGWRGATH